MKQNFSSVADTPRLATSVRWQRYVWALVIAWTLGISAFTGWAIAKARSDTVDLARTMGRTMFEKDILFRRWIALHGGVYAEVTPDTPPNPYLAKIPERDITMPSGRRLTLINPAYATRQMHELQKQRGDIIGHITSLKPIRPGNAPDAWERMALQRFEQGQPEVSSVERMGGRTYMRVMRPLITEESCLKCHRAQGYKVGDIRGGLSVSLPMAPFLETRDAAVGRHVLGFGLTWLGGLALIGAGALRLTREIRAHAVLEEQLRLCGTAIDTAGNAVMITDRAGRIQWVNLAFSQVSGYSREELIGQTPRILKSGKQDQDYYQAFWQTILAGRTWSGEITEKRKDGTHYTVQQTVTPIQDKKGQITHFIAISADITAQKEAQARIQYLAQYDALTGLANRNSFYDRLRQAIALTRRNKVPLAVLFLDLDRFKEVNDLLGHHVGDLLLQEVAERLRKCVRESDTVARLAGDEFTVILYDIGPEDAEAIARKIISSLGHSFSLEGQEINLGVSIGIAQCPRDTEDEDDLVRFADMAMYEAKRAGRNTYRFYQIAPQ